MGIVEVSFNFSEYFSLLSNPRPKRRRITSPLNDPKATGPRIISHRERARWRIPPLNSHTVILGDSNLSRATQLEAKVRSIECHSYPGAKLFHFANLLSPSLPPQDTPKIVVLSVGINHRTNQPHTFEQQLTNVIQNASRFFPNASIHIPLINIPPEISTSQQANLNHLNKLIQTLSEHSHILKAIPTLPQHHFQIDPKDTHSRIHWSTKTANSMIAHWTSHLNC